MNDSKKKSQAEKKGGGGPSSRFSTIGSVSVTCAPGAMPGTKNVTVTATGVVAPFGPPATSSLAGVPTALLKRNGTPVDSKTMNADPTVVGKWSVTFFAQFAGTFDAVVSLNWQILLPESAPGGPTACP